jgi:biopolymer transport protein ExbB/TolQ
MLCHAALVNGLCTLSEGIHNTFITVIKTVAGLCVAIPSLVAYNYLAWKVEGLVLEVACVCLRLLNVLQ